MNVGERVYIFGKHHVVHAAKRRLDSATGHMQDMVQLVPIDSEGKPKRKPSPFDWLLTSKVKKYGRINGRAA